MPLVSMPHILGTGHIYAVQWKELTNLNVPAWPSFCKYKWQRTVRSETTRIYDMTCVPEEKYLLPSVQSELCVPWALWHHLQFADETLQRQRDVRVQASRSLPALCATHSTCSWRTQHNVWHVVFFVKMRDNSNPLKNLTIFPLHLQAWYLGC